MSPAPLSMAYLFRGLRLLAMPGLRQFVWVPLLVNLLLYGLALWLGIRYFGAFLHWLLPAWLDFLRWLLWPLFALSYVFVMYFSFTAVANLIGSPFYGLLAEKVLEQARPGGVPRQPDTGVLGSLATELRRQKYFFVRAVPLLILFPIPGLNLAAPFLWAAFNAWSLGMEYLAYPLETVGMDFHQQRELAKTMRRGLFEFGGVAMCGLAIPVLNIFIAPAAVAGAALFVAETGVGVPAEGLSGS